MGVVTFLMFAGLTARYAGQALHGEGLRPYLAPRGGGYGFPIIALAGIGSILVALAAVAIFDLALQFKARRRTRSDPSKAKGA